MTQIVVNETIEEGRALDYIADALNDTTGTGPTDTAFKTLEAITMWVRATGREVAVRRSEMSNSEEAEIRPMVACGIVSSDRDVTTMALARVLVDQIMPALAWSRKIEKDTPDGEEGEWLIEFSPYEWEQLQAQGFVGYEDDETEISAEMP